jgi:hypothetical protein
MVHVRANVQKQANLTMMWRAKTKKHTWINHGGGHVDRKTVSKVIMVKDIINIDLEQYSHAPLDLSVWNKLCFVLEGVRYM